MFKMLIAALTSCAFLSACGGGGEGAAQAEGTQCQVTGVVQDIQGNSVPGATVFVELNRIYSTQSDVSGRYALHLPAPYPYPPFLAGMVTKDDYVPAALLFERSGMCVSSANATVLRPAADADVLLALGVGVTHLGDDNFSGAFNSQLQLPSSGLAWRDGFVYTAAMKDRYSRFCVSFHARGVQSAVHKDAISISREGDPATSQMQLMSNSDPSGAYTPFTYCFSLASYVADDRLEVEIRSGNGDGTLDYDDFEFVSVAGTLLP